MWWLTLFLTKTSRRIIIVHTSFFYHYPHTYLSYQLIVPYISTCDVNHLRLWLSLTNKPLHLMDHRLWTIDWLIATVYDHLSYRNYMILIITHISIYHIYLSLICIYHIHLSYPSIISIYHIYQSYLSIYLSYLSYRSNIFYHIYVSYLCIISIYHIYLSYLSIISIYLSYLSIISIYHIYLTKLSYPSIYHIISYLPTYLPTCRNMNISWNMKI